MASKTCFVVVSNQVDETFSDLVRGLRVFCPGVDVAWYNSGPRREVPIGLLAVPRARPLKYAKVTPSFLDILEWAAESSYDYVVNVETDLAFIKPGFVEFVESQMVEADYLAPGFRRKIPLSSQWPAYRTLQAELPTLLSILGMSHVNRGFSPAQVFSRRYSETVVSSDIFPALRGFVERNQWPERSNTLQELLLPTLVDCFGLRGLAYPQGTASFNRFRPFQGPRDLTAAHERTDVHFIHPVRRNGDDPVRAAVRALLDQHGTGVLMPEITNSPGTPQGRNLAKAALRGEDLFEARLTGAILREGTLSGAFIASADLRGADLSMAFLDGVFAKSAMLADADLCGASLRGADLREVNFTNAHLNGANLSGCYLGEADLTGADLREVNLAGADLREADLSGADLSRADLRGTLVDAVRWTAATTWPARHRAEIAARSEEVEPGVQQVMAESPMASELRLEIPVQSASRPTIADVRA